MPGITVADVHVNTPMTNVSVALIQDRSRFIASSAFPPVPVSKQSDLYYTMPAGAFNRIEVARFAEADAPRRAGYTLNTESYRCDAFGLGHLVSDRARNNADSALNLDQNATIFLTNQSLLNREKEFANAFFKTSVWTGDQTGVAASPAANQFLQWNDQSSTPIENIRARATVIHQRTGFRPNTMVLGRQTFDAMLNHPDIIDRVKYGQIAGGPAMANVAILAQLFEVDRVLVGDAIENTAKEGVTDSHSFIFGKGALLCYSPPNAGLNTPAAGYMFVWRGMQGTGATGTRILQRREPIGERGDLFEIEDYFDMKAVAADLGQYFASAVA